MKTRLLVFAFLVLTLSAHCGTTPMTPMPPSLPLMERVANTSLVRVNSTVQPYDFFRPWEKKSPSSRRGLGVVLKGGLILVTAELVANHTYVELEKAATADKAQAVVERVDYDANLALLRPIEPAFLDGLKPLALDSGARVGDRATVLQLEANGDVAETPATITTITIGGYPLDSAGLLVFRLSAPLQQRDGSFTLPAVRDGRLLGLLMRYDARNQTADVIPPPVINHFLAEASKAEYGGFARAGLVYSPLRDPQLRRYVGVSKPGGVYVTQVLHGGAAEQAGLREGDVILEVAGHAIDQDGNYDDPDLGRIAFNHLTNTVSHPGDTLVFKVFRKGELIDVPVVLRAPDRESVLSEPYVMDRAPRYVVLGGLVFLELSRPYLQEWGGNWMKDAPQRLVHYDAFQQEMPPGRGKIVFLSQVLPSPDTVGYEAMENLVVSKMNGREIHSLADLADAASKPNGGFHVIQFEEGDAKIVLDAASVEKNRESLKSQYGLPSLQRL